MSALKHLPFWRTSSMGLRAVIVALILLGAVRAGLQEDNPLSPHPPAPVELSK
ncbi:hypothetical protein [Rhodobium gokarnense]|uniref:Uncharacterized protein n=1 Tax=Rhodobium gokarnense TaxID=364296 RepID=A0ABT3HD15_9HYPH|nr:hypothetical protein [Rhodobium gokarnense]MCW2308286.1 hypothetical protein [Rhodobium gokarnense]